MATCPPGSYISDNNSACYLVLMINRFLLEMPDLSGGRQQERGACTRSANCVQILAHGNNKCQFVRGFKKKQHCDLVENE